ncbi:MAG: four helix bundle protein [Chitinophagaceae bacterium]|nr:MAG: four helix bundle protein [Chitinophagaceae bacterium]
MKKNILKEKSFAFAIRIVKLYQHLRKELNEYVLSKQVLRSGTSIGASIRESVNAASKRDFIHKLTVALKEADETSYWLELLYRTDLLNEKTYQSLLDDCTEIIRLLTSSLKTAKQVTA